MSLQAWQQLLHLLILSKSLILIRKTSMDKCLIRHHFYAPYMTLWKHWDTLFLLPALVFIKVFQEGFEIYFPTPWLLSSIARKTLFGFQHITISHRNILCYTEEGEGEDGIKIFKIDSIGSSQMITTFATAIHYRCLLLNECVKRAIIIDCSASWRWQLVRGINTSYKEVNKKSFFRE